MTPWKWRFPLACVFTSFVKFQVNLMAGTTVLWDAPTYNIQKMDVLRSNSKFSWIHKNAAKKSTFALACQDGCECFMSVSFIERPGACLSFPPFGGRSTEIKVTFCMMVLQLILSGWWFQVLLHIVCSQMGFHGISAMQVRSPVYNHWQKSFNCWPNTSYHAEKHWYRKLQENKSRFSQHWIWLFINFSH